MGPNAVRARLFAKGFKVCVMKKNVYILLNISFEIKFECYISIIYCISPCVCINQVQRWRVREVMLAMDPAGAALRGLAKKPHRRTYQVAGPNSLWHVDGNHKLIRYLKWNIYISRVN